jgi:hypothetical protein
LAFPSNKLKGEVRVHFLIFSRVQCKRGVKEKSWERKMKEDNCGGETLLPQQCDRSVIAV